MIPSPADWQLPPGVTRGLWDYLHDEDLARTYDKTLADSSLARADESFSDDHFDRPGGRLVDLGCGTGRTLIHFARRGDWVLGIDLSEEMLRIVGEKAAQAGVRCHRIKANLVELDGLCDQAFDYAVCLFSTLGMISGQSERQRMIGHVFRLLRPGGRFVLHVHNRWFNIWHAEGRRWLVRNLVSSWGGMAERGDRLMPIHQGIAGLTLHLFSRREVVRLLQGAGFRLRKVSPVSLKPDGKLPVPGWFGWLRAYGYLIAAERPGD